MLCLCACNMTYRKRVRTFTPVSLCEKNIHECSGDISGYLKKTNGRTKMDSELADCLLERREM